jgi:chemosensory pili system protein ChpA (sensor histidine kinase/response regulator)
MGSEFDQRDLVGVFVAEAIEGITALSAALYPDGQRVPTPAQLQEHYIVAHRLRGAAGLYGYGNIAQLSERLEMILEGAPNILEAQWPCAVEAMREMVRGIQCLIEAIRQGGGRGQEDEDLVERCLAMSVDLVPDATMTASPVTPAGTVSQEYLRPALDTEVLSFFVPEAEEYLDAMDGLIQTLRASPDDEDARHRLFRAAHTLKGSAYTVGFQVIGDVAHPVEDCMIAVREGRLSLTLELLDRLAEAARVTRLVLRGDQEEFLRLQSEVPAVICTLRARHDGAGAPPPAPPQVPFPHVQEVQPVPALPDGTDAAAAALPQGAPMPADYFVPVLDPEVESYFLPEAQEYLESLEANLLRLDKDPQNRELINQLFRTAHTLKGSAYTVGFQSIGDLIHHVEDFMGAVRDNRLHVLPGHTDQMLQAIDVVRVLLARDSEIVAGTRGRFEAALAKMKQLEEGKPIESTTGRVWGSPVAEAEHSVEPLSRPAAVKAAEGAPVEEREVVRVSYARLERLMNLVGELVIGRGRLEQRLRALEQLSQQVLVFKTRLIGSVQGFEEKYTFTYQSVPGQTAEPAAPGVPGMSDFGSLELDKYDDFNILARRISEVTADISESMSQLNGSIRKAHDDMSQLQQLTLGMRDEIARARMVPVGTPFTRFRRAIRDIARACNKEVTLVTSGEHTEVDTGVVERLVDPLIHLVRNAVYHGIESPADRLAKGKPAAGTVYLHAAHRGNSIIVEVEDDGAGLDYDRIRAKAVTLGLVRADQAARLSEAETLKFIFAPGFSTAEKIGEQAGRGVGLDAVNQVIERMGGHIDVESVQGVGTKFTLVLPLTLLIATALLVRTGEERYAIPLTGIREITMPTVTTLQQTGDRTVLQLAEEAIEVHALRHLLHRQQGEVNPALPVVIVRTAAGPAGLAVDELLGRQEIVIKTLGALKPLEDSAFGGATVDPEGRVILVIDPARLLARRPGMAPAVEPPSPAANPVAGRSDTGTDPEEQGQAGILLIDDSLSIRKFVGRMLESAGYQVETAVDGEDGLRKASAANYRLIITDLEMPKFNGFEVVQALRSRPQTRQTPVVVMTTRAGDKHRQMTLQMGANAHIPKPVDEQTLINEVRRWVGQAPAIRH